jgi:hypothetical protein
MAGTAKHGDTPGKPVLDAPPAPEPGNSLKNVVNGPSTTLRNVVNGPSTT